jgi:hypothetical protein
VKVLGWIKVLRRGGGCKGPPLWGKKAVPIKGGDEGKKQGREIESEEEEGEERERSERLRET